MARGRRKPLELIWLVLLSSKMVPRAAASSSSASSSVLSVSPVPNWHPSWAAASAHGTTVVVSFDARRGRRPSEGDAEPSLISSSSGCVILLRSQQQPLPPPSGNSLATPPHSSSDHHSSEKEEGGGHGSGDDDAGATVPLKQWVDTSRLVVDRVTRRWAWMPPSTLVSMTGLASDVDFLLASLLEEWDDRAVTYEGSDDDHHSSSRSSVLRHTQNLAELLYGAAQTSEGGRPFGVQCLLVGPPIVGPRLPSAQNGKDDGSGVPTTIFTLDPGGGHRHWGVATAIGRAADKVRRGLHEHLSRRGRLPEDARDALRVALSATVAALGDSEVKAGVDLTGAHYAALVVLNRGTGTREPLLGIVDAGHIQALRKELVAEKASDEHSNAGERAA